MSEEMRARLLADGRVKQDKTLVREQTTLPPPVVCDLKTRRPRCLKMNPYFGVSFPNPIEGLNVFVIEHGILATFPRTRDWPSTIHTPFT